MIQPRIAIEITDPDGNVLDVSDRIDRGGLNSISEEVAEDLIELVHSDMDLELRDEDGAIEAFFANAEPEDVYEISVVRDTLMRRPKSEKVFGGVIELPWSLRFDRKEQTVSIQAFSYSKLLERTSAEAVKRTIQDATGTASAAAATVTGISPDTGDLLPGDTISLDYDEERVILSVDSSSQVTVTENWGTAYSGKALTVLTPFYRQKSLDFLAGALFDESNVSDYNIVTGESIGGEPFATSMSDDGLPAGDHGGLLEFAGQVEVTVPTGTYAATNAQSGFAVHDAGQTVAEGDWRPYLATEPASLVAVNTADMGTYGNANGRAFDHTNTHYYTQEIDVPASNERLRVMEDGIAWAIIETAGGGISFLAGIYLDFEAGAGEVWISYGEDGGIRRVKKAAPGVTSIETAWGGGGVRTLNALGRVAIQNLDDGEVRFYTAGGTGYQESLPAGTPDFRMWTMRAHTNGTRLSVLYWSNGETRMRTYSWPLLEQVCDFMLDDTTNIKSYLTLFDLGGTNEQLLASVGVNMYVIDDSFAGVIPYADFDGMSASAALRELALMSMSVFEVDRFKVGSFRARGSALTNSAPAEIDTPLNQESIPIWEFYKASVKVEGETEAGLEIEATTGDTGDSARRMEITMGFAATESLLFAIGQAYLTFLSEKRRQESITIIENGTIHRTFDRVLLDGVEYMVLEPETGLLDREQSMQLVTV